MFRIVPGYVWKDDGTRHQSSWNPRVCTSHERRRQRGPDGNKAIVPAVIQFECRYNAAVGRQETTEMTIKCSRNQRIFSFLRFWKSWVIAGIGACILHALLNGVENTDVQQVSNKLNHGSWPNRTFFLLLWEGNSLRDSSMKDINLKTKSSRHW